MTPDQFVNQLNVLPRDSVIEKACVFFVTLVLGYLLCQPLGGLPFYWAMIRTFRHRMTGRDSGDGMGAAV